jgi:hypothetical protein
VEVYSLLLPLLQNPLMNVEVDEGSHNVVQTSRREEFFHFICRGRVLSRG